MAAPSSRSRPTAKSQPVDPPRLGSIVISAVEPRIDEGRYPVKRVVGDRLEVSADIFKEGHDVLSAVVRWRQLTPPGQATDWVETQMTHAENDRWTAVFPLERNGRYAFTIEAWVDQVRSWAHELTRKLQAGQNVKSELLEGAALLSATAERAKAFSPEHAEKIAEVARKQSAELALAPQLLDLCSAYPDRSAASRYPEELLVQADVQVARTGAWYEFFPRSASFDERRHGTFADCEKLLPEIEQLGFDVAYLPPIHPIGKTARKGKNNSTTAAPDDVGSPWAIGSAQGGHKAIHPELGTLEDFHRFLKKAAQHQIQIALDLAFQCSPDHPYLKAHPEWFHHRPDGTIKTAENPPKRYEDIVNFDFLGPGRQTLWEELKSVVLYWIEQGVRIFRVDNPHTKPVPFWAWLIEQVQREHPDTVFLSEAFTRPKMMRQLAKVGFSQSYTYFTWRNFKHELEEYLTELTQSPLAEYMRGNLWPNTPDILPEILQQGGPPAFKLRLVLAATLSSSYGIYSGYELCDGLPLPGKEEYLDSEKYQLVNWRSRKTADIRPYVAAVNRIRKENPALQLYTNLRFHRSSNDRVIFYGKATPDRQSQVLVAVSLDPFSSQQCTLEVPLTALGIGPDETYQVHEQLTNQRALWRGPSALVTLTPENPAAIWRVMRFFRSEQSFDYYG